MFSLFVVGKSLLKSGAMLMQEETKALQDYCKQTLISDL